MKRLTAVCLTLSLLGAAACGDDTDTPTDAGTDVDSGLPADAGGDPSYAVECSSGGSNVDLTGTWAGLVTNEQIFNHVVVGEGDVTNRYVYRINFTQNGSSVQASFEACDVTFTQFARISTVIYPDAAVALIGTKTLTATLSGTSLQLEDQVINLGWIPTGNPATEAVPDDVADGRVADQDADQNPGVSLQIDTPGVPAATGKIYVANRNITQFSGLSVNSADCVEGTSETNQEQSLFGGDAEAFQGAAIDTRRNPDKPSTFEAHRLNAGLDNSCAAIVANLGVLFP